METIAGILFWCGFVVACSDGEWFPYINYIGALVAVIGAAGIQLLDSPIKSGNDGFLLDSPVKPENDKIWREGK